jgi:hypothetical protein
MLSFLSAHDGAAVLIVSVVEARNRLEKTALPRKATGQVRIVMAYGRGLDPGYSRATRVKLGAALRDELGRHRTGTPNHH